MSLISRIFGDAEQFCHLNCIYFRVQRIVLALLLYHTHLPTLLSRVISGACPRSMKSGRKDVKGDSKGNEKLFDHCHAFSFTT